MAPSYLAIVVLAAAALTAKAISPGQPGVGPDHVAQHYGYITVNGSPKNGSHLFYWMFESRHDPTTDPLVLWLTGGPGCSAMLAMLTENGPFKVDAQQQTSINPYSWNSKANLLYVDQPVGTGFSYADSPADYVRNEEQMADQLYGFLQQFLQMYPKYASLNFFITGESYAGHYIPAISHRIYQANKNGEGLKINLRGLAIGNGLVDPYIQFGAYATFAYNNQLITHTQYSEWKLVYDACKTAIASRLWTVALDVCEPISNGVLSQMGRKLGFQVNPYDIRIPCGVPGLCYNFTAETIYLNSPAVQQALGVKRQWTACASTVERFLLNDIMKNLEVLVPDLLDGAGYKVLVYHGVDDYICNYVGGSEWTAATVWSGQSGFNNATAVPCT